MKAIGYTLSGEQVKVEEFVGTIKSASEGIRFQYNQEGVKQAKKLGFCTL
jgi:hypothetical protein